MSDHTTSAADDGAEDATTTDAAVTELHGCPLTDSHGQSVVHPTRDQYLDLVKALADEGYTMLVDLCGVDYLRYMDRPLPDRIVSERFEVVVNLVDLGNRRRLRVRVQVPEGDPVLPSLFEVHPSSEPYERETFDMFGVSFTDHPDMTRILMPEDWIGHPLRKDYEVGKIPVQFKGSYA
jgi:NADH-quinone oxidoreductase subunit C